MKRIKFNHPESDAVVEVDESQSATMEHNGWHRLNAEAPAKYSKPKREGAKNGKSKG